jgi:GNAT superfamily N-acetyltransferase
VIAREYLLGAATEMHALILGYYADTEAQEGIPPLKMDWVFYANLEQQNKLFILTDRDQVGELRGFAMYILGNHPQHAGMPFALCNTLAVATRHRGRGIGSQLVKEAIHYLREMDVKMMVHGHRTVYDATPLFPKLGFELTEHIYMRML